MKDASSLMHGLQITLAEQICCPEPGAPHRMSEDGTAFVLVGNRHDVADYQRDTEPGDSPNRGDDLELWLITSCD